jgi:predicted esterase
MRVTAWFRLARSWAWSAIASGLSLVSVPTQASPVEPGGRLLLRNGVNAVAYAPRELSGRRPVTVMLHGMCGAPERECPSYVEAATQVGWLVCPRAPVECEGGGHSWSSPSTDGVIEAALTELERRFPEQTQIDQNRVLVGFSLGAITAMHVAHGGRGRYRDVILIGAKIFPDERRLLEAKVARLVLVSGDYDMMHDHMQREYQRLQQRGYPAFFVSLGKIGHAYPSDMSAQMTRIFDDLRVRSPTGT